MANGLPQHVHHSVCDTTGLTAFQNSTLRPGPRGSIRRPAFGSQNQYSQIYGPLGKGDNYTSPLLHTIKLTGLSPKTRYYYQCALSVLLCLHPSAYLCRRVRCVRCESLASALTAVPCLTL